MKASPSNTKSWFPLLCLFNRARAEFLCERLNVQLHTHPLTRPLLITVDPLPAAPAGAVQLVLRVPWEVSGHQLPSVLERARSLTDPVLACTPADECLCVPDLDEPSPAPPAVLRIAAAPILSAGAPGGGSSPRVAAVKA